MIFNDKILEKRAILEPIFNNLFALALTNQTHPGDLLLVHLNGGFDSNSNDRWPNVIGPNNEGHSESTHFTFIDFYRKNNLAKIPYPDYLKQLEWTKERKDEIEQIIELEGLTIQLEMLIYIKIWEADLIIKKLYELVRLVSKDSYDWFFKVALSSRDKQASGTRQDIIRLQIRDKIKAINATLFEVIEKIYLTQIRNSIAHSNYSIMGRHIHPNNEILNDPSAQIKSLSFDKWIDIFHFTLMIHDELQGFENKIFRHYSEIAEKNGNKNTIRLVNKQGESKSVNVVYRPEWKDWRPE